MPKTISNGTLREMTSDEEIEYNKSIEADNLLEAERAKVKYKDDRKMAYPEIGDQLDALYHAGVFPKEMADKIKAVKDANPKPE
tara:strand:- start:36 stop:287 length:252 start_codon:yes stop_codon:yes gene_type:complete